MEIVIGIVCIIAILKAGKPAPVKSAKMLYDFTNKKQGDMKKQIVMERKMREGFTTFM